MTDTAPRSAPTRGRGSARGGRGGSRGGARHRDRQPNGGHVKDTTAFDDPADQGELGEMKKQYSSQLSTLKELFSDWTDVDLLFALQETDGDLNRTIEHITEGHVAQFSDVKKTKDRAKPKAKDQSTSADSSASRVARGRGGHDGSRGTRGRPDRARGALRGGRGGPPANGVRAAAAPASAPIADIQDWSTPSAEGTEKVTWDSAEADGASAGQWGSVGASATASVPAPEGTKTSLISDGGPKKTWAQMFAKPAPVAVPPKPIIQPAATPEPAPAVDAGSDAAVLEPEEPPTPPLADEAAAAESLEILEPPNINIEETPVELAPSKDQLTEDNVEHLPDMSHPAPTGTAASTVDSTSRGPDSATPSVVGQSLHSAQIARPAMGGYATTAYKATSTGGRSASFTRRLFEQQEAVVLPGNHAVDRVGVQFGQMGLNGDDEDVDEDREDAETRTQPPQHSPQSQPRASLPSAPKQSVVVADAPQESITVPKPAPGLPPAPQQQGLAQQSPSATMASQLMPQQGAQSEQAYGQLGRYGSTVSSSEPSATSQKPFDPFGQQQTQSPFGGYPSQSHAPTQQQQAPSQLAAFSSAPSEYSSFYTSDQQRNAYQNYYGTGYGQQSTSSQQDAGASQQRAGSAFASTAGEAGFPSSQTQQAQSRYGDTQHSGHTTPNPSLGGQQQPSAQSQHAQHMHQQPHTQNQHGSGYPYGAQAHAYYNRMDPYYAAYVNTYGYNQGGFGGGGGGGGGGGFGKGGMYGAPHHGYGMNPQSGYDQHSSSPANVSGFGQSAMRSGDASISGSLGDYSRSGSAQPPHGQQQASGASGFGGMSDMFSRSGGGFPSQSQGYGQQQSGAQTTGADDSLKPFGEPKATSGPSPGALGQPGRPGSATNTAAQAQGSGLPPPQSQQHGFAAYGGHMNQMQSGQASQYGGLGGLSSHQGGQGHQGGGYGYGGGFGGNSYSYPRGGWGGNYGH